MAVNIVTTEGDAGANSYSSVAEADGYADMMPGCDDWNELSDDDKSRFLILATEMIDGLSFAYEKFNASQALMFPLNVSGASAGMDRAKKACVRQAIYLARFYESIMAAHEDSIEAISRKNLGGVYTEKLSSNVNQFLKLANGIRSILVPYICLDFKMNRG